MSEWDWVTISALATAAGTLVLALATFAAVRSANRNAITSERAFSAALRPVLVTARSEDPEQRLGFVDGRWLRVQGRRAAVEPDGTRSTWRSRCATSAPASPCSTAGRSTAPS